jgi:hypothetical protein
VLKVKIPISPASSQGRSPSLKAKRSGERFARRFLTPSIDLSRSS